MGWLLMGMGFPFGVLKSFGTRKLSHNPVSVSNDWCGHFNVVNFISILKITDSKKSSSCLLPQGARHSCYSITRGGSPLKALDEKENTCHWMPWRHLCLHIALAQQVPLSFPKLQAHVWLLSSQFRLLLPKKKKDTSPQTAKCVDNACSLLSDVLSWGKKSIRLC